VFTPAGEHDGRWWADKITFEHVGERHD
jgi:hypothetical protein